ncbi:MAG: hypothetical protein WDN72_02505 [Alphaproteobacteria bacterium]
MTMTQLQAETTDSADLAKRPRARRRRIDDQMLEIIMGILLAIAGVTSSWGGYQAALWDGQQAAEYTRAGAVRAESVRASNEAGQLELADVAMFTEWLDAYAAGDTRRADFYRARFRPEFVPAFEAWVASEPMKNPKAYKLPFNQPQYHQKLQDAADARAAEAAKAFADGQKDNAVSDMYVRATVLFAMAMFFIGVAQQFKFPPVRLWLAIVAALMLGIGLADVVHYPVAVPG